MKREIKIIIIVAFLLLVSSGVYLTLKEISSEEKIISNYNISLGDFIENKDIPCLIKMLPYPCENETR